MPRSCTVCDHLERREIDVALARGDSFRVIAQRFPPVSPDALRRHKATHLPVKLVQATQAAAVLEADDLLGQARALYGKSVALLKQAEATGDVRTALTGIREARGCLELLGKLAGELQAAPVTNILILPEWRAIRSTLIDALAPYPDARSAVAGALLQLEAHDAGD